MTTITYAMIREKMRGKLWTMDLVLQEEVEAMTDAVNQGIDSHLEACYFPDEGDKYEMVEEKFEGEVISRKLSCTVSVKSFPVLLRRLQETKDEAAKDLLEDILYILGFPEDESLEIISPVDEPGYSPN